MIWRFVNVVTPEQQAKLDALREKRLQDWTPKIKWSKHLVIRASTYTPPSLFKVKPTRHADPAKSRQARECKLSPGRQWIYRERVLPKWGRLYTMRGSEEGMVEFDGEVVVPMINEALDSKGKRYKEHPWMSFTPMEHFSMRAGIKAARGRVVVAGLGMGQHLVEVCKKRTVTEVVLVERNQDLIDWILPQLDTNDKLVDTVCGDAYVEMPKLTADTAVVDIFETYGNNKRYRARLKRTCPNIGDIWVWGSAYIDK